MKAKTLPLFIALAALGLTACGPTDGESSVTTSESTETTSETTPDETSTSETTPPAPGPNWTEDELALIEAVLGENHPIPYYDFAAAGVEHEFSLGLDADGGDVIVITAPAANQEVLAGFKAAHIESEIYVDNTLLYGLDPADGLTVLDGTYDDGSEVQLQISLVNADGSTLPATATEGIFQAVYFPGRITVAEWPAEEITALIETATGVPGVVLPVPTLDGERSYATYMGYDSYDTPYALVDISGNAAAYSEDLEAAGWKEVEGAIDFGRYYASPDDAISLFLIDYDFNTGFTTLQIGVNTLLTQWPAATVGEFLDTLAADGEATPLPALPNPVNFYQVDDYASYGIYYIYAYGEDQVDAYVQVLLDAGFTAAAYIDGEFYYGDPKGDYLVNVAYDPDYGTTDIYLSAWEDNYVTEWPADTIADQLKVYSPESTAVLPEPTFEWQFGTIYVFVEDGSFNIDLIDLADDGTFVPHADEYAAQLNAADSGWTYDATKEAWFDATGKVMVTVFDDPDYGTSIYMESVPYVDTYAELGVDETLAGLGITKTIPALDGAAYYEDLSGDSALQFLAYGVDQADYDAYVAALEGEGYLHGYHPDFGTLYWDAELSLTIQVVFDDESGTIGVLVQNGEIWGYTDTKLDNATMFLSLLLGVTVPHFPVEAKTPVYFTTGIEEWFVGYVFATGFIAEYETALLAAGYVKDETPVEGTTASYSFETSSKVYSLQITEDVANNCTEIVVL